LWNPTFGKERQRWGTRGRCRSLMWATRLNIFFRPMAGPRRSTLTVDIEGEPGKLVLRFGLPDAREDTPRTPGPPSFSAGVTAREGAPSLPRSRWPKSSSHSSGKGGDFDFLLQREGESTESKSRGIESCGIPPSGKNSKGGPPALSRQFRGPACTEIGVHTIPAQEPRSGERLQPTA